jgi:hypothetical protein
VVLAQLDELLILRIDYASYLQYRLGTDADKRYFDARSGLDEAFV